MTRPIERIPFGFSFFVFFFFFFFFYRVKTISSFCTFRLTRSPTSLTFCNKSFRRSHSYPFTPDQESEIMATRVSQRQLIIQSENLDIYGKAVLDGNTKNSKKDIKKSGVALGHRQALGDITNKDPLHHEASLKKKNMIKEEFNEAEEMFLHDHRKCIEEQLKSMNTFSLELVLPGHGSIFSSEYPEAKEAQADIESPQFYPEPEELPMLEFSDWLKSSTRWISPPSSPTCSESPPLSPSSWHFERVEYALKGESDY